MVCQRRSKNFGPDEAAPFPSGFSNRLGTNRETKHLPSTFETPRKCQTRCSHSDQNLLLSPLAGHFRRKENGDLPGLAFFYARIWERRCGAPLSIHSDRLSGGIPDLLGNRLCRLGRLSRKI